MSTRCNIRITQQMRLNRIEDWIAACIIIALVNKKTSLQRLQKIIDAAAESVKEIQR